MRMCDKLLKRTGKGHRTWRVTGEALARAIPAALEVNIREALDALEEDNKLMVDGPHGGLEGVIVREIKIEAGGR